MKVRDYAFIFGQDRLTAHTTGLSCGEFQVSPYEIRLLDLPNSFLAGLTNRRAVSRGPIDPRSGQSKRRQ